MSAGRYDGPIEVGTVFTCPDNDGVLGYRRVMVVGTHSDGKTLILEEMPGRIRSTPGSVFKCPEINLRMVFVPEAAT